VSRIDELLAAITAAPDDDEVRLVYADAIAAADPAHAELITAQIAIARGNTDRELERRVEDLLGEHAARIAGPIADHARVHFERGFVERLEIIEQDHADAAHALVEHHATLPAVRAIGFTAHDRPGLFDEGALVLARSPLCSQLTALELAGTRIGPDGLAALAPELSALRWLSFAPVWFANNALGVEGARILAAAEFPHLEDLNVGGTNIGDDGLHAIVAAPWFAHVTELDLSDCSLTDIGLGGFVARASTLERLHLRRGIFGGGYLQQNRFSLPMLHRLERLRGLQQINFGRGEEEVVWLAVPLDREALARQLALPD